jgi:Fic family protein
LKKQPGHNRTAPPRPRDKIELDDLEVAGLWKAIALAKDIGEDHTPIDLTAILSIHKEILHTAEPEVAGRFRIAGEDVKKLACIEPPLGVAVYGQMIEFEKDLLYKLTQISHNPERSSKRKYKEWLNTIFDLAAWVQYKLSAIHPFCEGNGRLARIMTNVVLSRFRLPVTDVKIEGEDKPQYLTALCQIDEHGDFELLKRLIIRGSTATYLKEQERRRQNTQAGK